jgi:adenylate cyclase
VSETQRKRLPFSPFGRRFLVGAAIGLGAATLALFAGQFESTRFEFLDRVEKTSYDRRVAYTAQPVAPASPIVIVDINESTVRAMEPLVGRWPWPRAVHAAAIDYLTRAGAKVIAYDVLFGEHEGRSETVINGQHVTGIVSDRALAESVRTAGNVIELADAVFEGRAKGDSSAPPALPGRVYRPGPGFQARPDLQLPFDDLAAVVRGVGHNVLVREEGSDFARRMLPFVDVHGTAVPSLGVAAALAYLDVPADRVALDGAALRLGAVTMPLLAEPTPPDASGARGASRQALLRFRRPVTGADGVTSTFPSYSFYDVLLSGDQLAAGRTPAIPPSAFAGKLVFVGTSAEGTYDRYLTPFSGGVGGVELHATLADNILSGQFMARAPAARDVTVTLATGLAAALGATLLPVFWAIAGALVLGAGLVAWTTHEVGQGVWAALVMPALADAGALFAGIAWQYVVEGREKRQVRRLFGRYVSPDVINQLMADPGLARLGGQRREMTVLFSDIRGFTTFSEAGSPEDVVAQLNEYFSAMVGVLFRHRGTLDKFVGDMVMGLFGAPLVDPDHADHAVATALDMMAELGRLNDGWRAQGRPTLDIGIGINSGEMIAGNIGAEAVMSYTVIGDAVNLGSRLESLNKQYGTHILISEETRARLTMAVETRPIGEVVVKGRARPVQVHEVVRYLR